MALTDEPVSLDPRVRPEDLTDDEVDMLAHRAVVDGDGAALAQLLGVTESTRVTRR